MSHEKVKIQMMWSWILGIHSERPLKTDPKYSKSKINVMIYNQSSSEIFLFQPELQLGHQLTSLDTVSLSIQWAVLQPINLFQAEVAKVGTFLARTPTAQSEQAPTIKTSSSFKILPLQITRLTSTTPALISIAVLIILLSPGSLNINNLLNKQLIKIRKPCILFINLMNLLNTLYCKMSWLKSGNSSLKSNMEVSFKLNKCCK